MVLPGVIGELNSGLEGYPFLVYTCYGNEMVSLL